MCASFAAHMKSLRLTLAAFLLAGIASVHAADAQKDATPSEKKSTSDSKKTSAKSDKKSSDSKKDSAKSDKKSSDDKSSALPDPVAVVEGTPIKKAELEKEFNNALATAGKPATDLTAAQKQQGYHAILDDMIIDRLLRKRSADMKVADEEVDKSITQIKSQFPSEEKLNEELKKSGQTLDKIKENIRISLKEQQWIESQIADKTAVTDADAQGFYDKNTDKFKMPESVRASHILFAVPQDAKPDVVAAKEKLAKATEDRVKKGEDFAKLATELSEDPSAKSNSGDLDFFTHDRMVPEFADAAFKMKVGDISDPVKSQYGFHIIKVTGRKEARTVPFDEAKEKILGYLKESKKRSAVTELLTSMRGGADVKVNLAPLPAPSAAEQLAPPAP